MMNAVLYWINLC